MVANIAQIELFHVGGQKTFGELSREILARVHEDLSAGDFDRPTSIKTCFRIYDWSGDMTRYALDLESMPSLVDDYEAYTSAPTRLGRWLASRRERRNSRRRANLKQMMTADAGRLVREAIDASDSVAIEVAEHRYRMMRRDEATEMRSRATHYSHAWLFVFEPNELLADRNEIVGSIALVL